MKKDVVLNSFDRNWNEILISKFNILLSEIVERFCKKHDVVFERLLDEGDVCGMYVFDEFSATLSQIITDLELDTTNKEFYDKLDGAWIR